MILILAVLLIAQPLAPAPKPGSTPSQTRTAKPGDQHAIGEEVITGQAEVKIQDMKPYFAPQIDPFGPINSRLAPETYVLDEGLYRSVDSITIPQHFTHSSFLRTPVERDFVYGDMMVFLPSFETRVATWELVVSNSLGETVRRVKRKGQPPAVITWDGRADDGEGIAPGEVYGFTFNAYDAQGNQTRIPGAPQRVSGVVYQAGEEWVVAVAADQLFTQSGSQLLTRAAARLDEVANVVKEKFTKEVAVYVYTEQEQLSAERCNVIRAEIARRVVLPDGALRVVPRFVPGLTPKYSKVEVHIL